MKQNKHKLMPRYTTSSAVKGFTLMEFLVASMLAMIVIVAASGTYMITRKLNNSAQERISVQQDIRNASVQMARDARMAGSFGCFNTGDNNVVSYKQNGVIKASNANVGKVVFLNDTDKDGYGVRRVSQSDVKSLSLSGLKNPSDALLFIYGQSATSVKITNGLKDYKSSNDPDSLVSKIQALTTATISDKSDPLYRALTGTNKGDVVLSSCAIMTQLPISNVSGTTALNVNVANGGQDMRANDNQAGEMTLSKLHASLYVLGEINRGTQNQWADEKALLRYDLGADGKWQNPQLLATGIKSMTFAFGYVDSTNACKAEATDAAKNSETFSFIDNPANNTIGRKLPALVQVRLKYFINKPTGTQSDADTRDYIINTTVRGGNTCTNRLVS